MPSRLNSGDRLVICVAEDRKSCEPSLRLLLTSLRRYSADVAIIVFCPHADAEFIDWTRGDDFGRIDLRTAPVAGAYGWNVKPQALLQLLSEGHREVVWIDSDIVATKDVRPAFAQLDSGVLVATEEALWTQNVTAQVW
jgi:hypothetical protein